MKFSVNAIHEELNTPCLNYNDVFDYLRQYIDIYFERDHEEHEIAEYYMPDFEWFIDRKFRWLGEYIDESVDVPVFKCDLDNYLAWRFEDRTMIWMEENNG